MTLTLDSVTKTRDRHEQVVVDFMRKAHDTKLEDLVRRVEKVADASERDTKQVNHGSTRAF